MFRYIHAWLKERRDLKALHAYEDGYGWAMAERYLNKRPIEYVRDCCEEGMAGQDSRDFDMGALEAVRFIEAAQVHQKELAREITRLRNKPLAPVAAQSPFVGRGIHKHPPIPSPT